MVTAAAVAHVDRLPLLLLPGDVFASRRPDPVLQQIEAFGDGTVSANDCFRPVSRYFDRIEPTRTGSAGLRAGDAGANRPGRVRPGDAGLLPGRADRGGGFSGALVRAAAMAGAAAAAGPARTGRGRRLAARGKAAAGGGRRRRALRRGRGRTGALLRGARPARRRDPGRQILAARLTSDEYGRHRRYRHRGGERAGRRGRCDPRRGH